MNDRYQCLLPWHTGLLFDPYAINANVILISHDSSNQLRELPAFEVYQCKKVLGIIGEARQTKGTLTDEFMAKYNNIWHVWTDAPLDRTNMGYCAKYPEDVMCEDYLDYVILSIGDGQMEMNDGLKKMHIDRINDAAAAVKSFGDSPKEK